MLVVGLKIVGLGCSVLRLVCIQAACSNCEPYCCLHRLLLSLFVLTRKNIRLETHFLIQTKPCGYYGT